MVNYAIFIGIPDVFQLEIKPRSGARIVYQIPALASHIIFNNYWRRYSTVNDPKKRKENPLEFKMLDDKSGYLRLSDFHTPVWAKYNYSHSTEFRTIFKFIKDKNIQNLVVDLRGNEGGNPAYPTESWSRPLQPGANNFKGKLYVLTDGATGSAAAILAALIRVNRKDAIFIGEECGGDMEGPVSGGGTDITLPNSGIKVDIPFIRRVINLNGFQNTKAHGVLPDHRVRISPDDLFHNNDPVLQFTMGLF